MNLNMTLIGELIAFIVFVIFCMKYVWPPIIGAIEARQAVIADGLAASDRAAKDLELAQEKATAQLKDAKAQAAGIVEAAKRTGSKIIIDDKLPKELNDMAATLSKVKATNPDVLVVSGHTKGALTAVRQISEMKVDVKMLAMTHCDAAKLSKQHGKASEYALCASPVSYTHLTLPTSDLV